MLQNQKTIAQGTKASTKSYWPVAGQSVANKKEWASVNTITSVISLGLGVGAGPMSIIPNSFYVRIRFGQKRPLMHHFVQYHNFDKIGPYYASRKSFGIVTSKCLSSLLGGTVWLVLA